MSPPPARPELDRSDPRALNDFTDVMRRYIECHPPTTDTLESANSYLFKLERDTVKIVRRINRRYGKNKKRSDYKDGWSPHYAAMKIHMQTLFYIRRHLLQQKKYHRWHTDDDVFTGISNLVQQWLARTDALGVPSPVLHDLRMVTGRGPEYWKTLSSRPRIQELETDIQLLQSKMHGRLRSEMRSAISNHSARREMLRELGQTKVVLKSVLGRMGGRKHQDPLFLGAVRE